MLPRSTDSNHRRARRAAEKGPPERALLVSGSHRDEERLPLLDDVRGELRGVAAADVCDRVDRLAGTSSASPALNVAGGLPSIRQLSDPSRT